MRTSNKWKSIVKAAIIEANENEVEESFMKYKKLKNRKIVQKEYGLKSYAEELSLNQSRTIFRHKTSMTEHVKLNYKGIKRYEPGSWKCDECSNLDSEEHLLWCPGYEELREDLNLENDGDLSKYLQKIYLKRNKRK